MPDRNTFPFLNPGLLTDGELELILVSRTQPDPAADLAPAYRFEMRVTGQKAGGIRFRPSDSENVRVYAGHIGYNVDLAFRGHHLAERASRLLLPLARQHGFHTLWITCDPDNVASRRTCERLGAAFEDIVVLPESTDMFRDGEREKCRYRLEI